VIHRDIKPENILMQSGRPLLADFGIALAVQQAGGGRLTQTGLSLGTPSYMSPEQAAADKRVDARSDIYSLGAVAYEMLAGEPPFAAPSTQAVLMKVMTEEPRPVTGVRPNVPAGVNAAVLTALAKRPADRFGSAREFADALEQGWAQRSSGGQRTTALPATRTTRASRTPTLALAGVAVAASAAALWGWLRPRPAAPSQPPSVLALPTSEGMGGATGQARFLDISPGGDVILYSGAAASGIPEMYAYRLDQGQPVRIPGTENAIDMRVTPDGRSVWFGVNGSGFQSYRVVLDGSRPELQRNGTSTAYASWAPDGTLWYSVQETLKWVHILADGSEHEMPIRGEARQLLLQQVLPDGRHAIAIDVTSRAAEGILTMVDLDAGTHRPLMDVPVVEARWTVGYLVYVRNDGSMFAVAMDAASGATSGPKVRLAEQVGLTGGGIAQFAVSDNGTVVYMPQEPRQLVLVDRSGRIAPLLEEWHNYHNPRFSPDGNRIALDFTSPDGRDVWVYDRAQGTLTRLTSLHDGHDAEWALDGRSLTFSSSRSGAFGIWRQRPGAPAESLMASGDLTYTGRPLADGGFVATGTGAGTGGDIVRVGADRRITPLVASEYDEAWPAVSPDGRWLAYTSTLSGTSEVYVRALEGDDRSVQVSLKGGTEPVFSRDGRELFYRSAGPQRAEYVAAAIETAGGFTVRSRTPLFPAGNFEIATPHANWDVSPDGRSFVLVHRIAATKIIVLQNLPELVRRRQGEPQP
jgi:serine/threonine-protein kinase